ncbi:conserved hypothetical protein [Methanosalsum zhilinae DSM 4017]|uniref:Uncharacterized protein n=1 Tax=Methanosalsum zhilinae (strain DSM 4017 / NBRC 107636 / OCM 62 / WeN5) TaxID=679901 RepID=F7XLI7_METZD|nr:hypothetical protein [Methanosalsum zhilinae]AEH60785.1 conserved hypothetical protein [Methanosalsum zhilinae DSM 4017]
MTTIKNAPRTSTTLIVRSDANSRITHSKDPFYTLMRRLFQEEKTALRGKQFLSMIEERQNSGEPIKTSEWKQVMEELGVGRASFYAMRNKLLGAGLITNKNEEYRLSGQFSKDLMDMANWWWTAVLGNKGEL